MAWEKNLFTLTFPVDADSSAYQYHAMSLNTDGELVIATATTTANVGILQNDDADTALDEGLVCVLGVSKALCDGNSANIAIGDKLASDAAGHLEKTTTDGDDFIAVALEACTADGVLCSVFVMPFGEVSTG